MVVLLAVLLFLAVGATLVLLVIRVVESSNARKQAAADAAERERVAKLLANRETQLDQAQTEVQRLSKWTGVADADDRARAINVEAAAMLAQAQQDARILLETAERQFQDRIAEADIDADNLTKEARSKAREARQEAEKIMAAAFERAGRIIADANASAEQIAGKAMDAVNNAAFYERTVRAMKNIIDGYGDAYLQPTHSLLDDLAEDYSHKEAGQELKRVRDYAKVLIKEGRASACDYVETNRRETAERFVLDAFNGKVDSIMSRVRHDNHGTLAQEIKDAFTLVNFNGKAFRDARVTDDYLAICLEELRWAAAAHELRRQDQEEQRRLREQIREEAKVQREIAKALKDAEREEQAVRRALATAEAKMGAASADDRARFEAELEALRARLGEAEARGQRAISLAQQTKRGNVYIISNVGSFGPGVYKIGLTRRLDPEDRIKELGDASVPFGFDIHAMIRADDAPALECRLHKHFVLNQINKVNHRKEFFRADIADLRREIEALGHQASWTMAAEAAQYRESLAIDRAIESDPAAREAWINRQLTLDPVDERELVGALTDDDGDEADE